MKVLIVDRHAIFRRGLAASLHGLTEVAEVSEASDVREARGHASLAETDVIIVDPELEDAPQFIGEAKEAAGARVVVCCSGRADEAALASVAAGAVGVLSKDALTPEALATGVRAVLYGCGILTTDLLPGLLLSPTENGDGGDHAPASSLTSREQRVLRLIAEGHATREIAQQLSFSERTIKNVLHDIGAKLGARSRSQAVACALREKLI